MLSTIFAASVPPFSLATILTFFITQCSSLLTTRLTMSSITSLHEASCLTPTKNRSISFSPICLNCCFIRPISGPKSLEPNHLVKSVTFSRTISMPLAISRRRDMAKGMEIVLENVTDFTKWFGSRDLGPLIGRMKQQFRQIGENEMERFFVGVRQEASCREVMEDMVNRVVNKLLHCVIKNVNIVAKENGGTEAAKMVGSIVRQAEEIMSESGGGK